MHFGGNTNCISVFESENESNTIINKKKSDIHNFLIIKTTFFFNPIIFHFPV